MPVTAQPDRLLLENQLCFPLYAVSRLMTRLYQPLLDPLGLTYPQYIVLMILWADAPCTVSHIGKRAQLASNTLTPLLKRLEQLGFVTRDRASEDERVVKIGLTEAGRALKVQCACIPTEVSDRIGRPMEELLALKLQLDNLMSHMQKLVE